MSPHSIYRGGPLSSLSLCLSRLPCVCGLLSCLAFEVGALTRSFGAPCDHALVSARVSAVSRASRKRTDQGPRGAAARVRPPRTTLKSRVRLRRVARGPETKCDTFTHIACVTLPYVSSRGQRRPRPTMEARPKGRERLVRHRPPHSRCCTAARATQRPGRTRSQSGGSAAGASTAAAGA